MKLNSGHITSVQCLGSTVYNRMGSSLSNFPGCTQNLATTGLSAKRHPNGLDSGWVYSRIIFHIKTRGHEGPEALT